MLVVIAPGKDADPGVPGASGFVVELLAEVPAEDRVDRHGLPVGVIGGGHELPS